MYVHLLKFVHCCLFQELKQERYGLHLKFENLEGEYENTVKELQYDITQLRDQLERHRQETHIDDRDKNRKIQTISQQVGNSLISYNLAPSNILFLFLSIFSN